MFVGSILQQKARRYAAKKRKTNTTIKSTASLPRLFVIRSLAHISVQLIWLDGHIIAAANDTAYKGTKSEKAFEVGKKIADLAKKAGVTSVAFDRNGYLYHGRVKKLAEGAREGGLQF